MAGGSHRLSHSAPFAFFAAEKTLEEWSGVKAVKAGKSKVKIFVREPETERYLERELDVEVK
ncbi:MAG: hypothetical protein RDV41_06595 [Planctomycetota bacterium]|nr:hypothetical protein [Planctomycetota bacterium]